MKKLLLLLVLSTAVFGGYQNKKPADTKDPSAEFIQIILDQKEDRYARVKEILEKDPIRLHSIVWKLEFVWYGDGRVEDKSPKTVTAITAAVYANDFEMAKLLASRGAEVCDDVGDVTCPTWLAKKLGRTEIYEYLLGELRFRQAAACLAEQQKKGK